MVIGERKCSYEENKWSVFGHLDGGDISLKTFRAELAEIRGAVEGGAVLSAQ